MSNPKLHTLQCGVTARLSGYQNHAAPGAFVPQFGSSVINAIGGEIELRRATPARLHIKIRQERGHGRWSIKPGDESVVKTL
ncbi:hypothetical protein J2X90_005870 [Variovorax paradoxus]|nr:hypothetical protein [Variovorax paradoxus]